MTEEIMGKLEEILQDKECVEYLGKVSDTTELKTFLSNKGVEVDDEFAKEMIKNRDKVLASDEIPEEYLEAVSGGGFKGMLLGAVAGAGVGLKLGGVHGMVFGGLVGAIVGGLGTGKKK